MYIRATSYDTAGEIIEIFDFPSSDISAWAELSKKISETKEEWVSGHISGEFQEVSTISIVKA